MRSTLHRLGSAAAAIGLAAGLGVISTGSAQADVGPGWWTQNGSYQISSDWGTSANCLDNSSQYGLRMYPCNAPSYNNGYQKWKAINTDDVTDGAQLQSQAPGSNGCLDWSPQYGLRTYSCNWSSFINGYQNWEVWFRTDSSGGQEIVLKNGLPNSPSICLDNSQYGVRGYACNGASQDAFYQGWQLQEWN
ncbi:hypothetical protein [Kitasatospora viridis]|uniref:Uncharacterized protein n=1 Tax=Kitasatospora viridis TaxID=281105 RepID=A0A561UQA2_9ACTN|nr:hypothetical protein [Kitasatospora viridis]TWG01538.1 hypothetical protein FHX73_115439 [Kitasatospora viridis]